MAEPRIMIPQNLPDLLAILRKRPDCVIRAGGTWLDTNGLGDLEMERHDMIGLGRIEELGRIYRTERFTDIGGLVTLERLLRLDPSIIPPGLQLAAAGTVPAPTRSLATIGGNICLPVRKLNLLPWMVISDARMEVRRQGSVRFLNANRFLGHDGEPALAPGEILTRIRIPLGRWNHQGYRRLQADPGTDQPLLALMILASIQRDRLEEVRIMAAFSNREMLRFTLADAELSGFRLPLQDRQIHGYLQLAREIIDDRHEPHSELTRRRLLLGLAGELCALAPRPEA